jgi:predicted alpha/beta superfamily hydrolase
MKKTILLLFLTLAAKAQQNVSSGIIVPLGVLKSEFIEPRNVDVWLPEGYSEKEKYAVLYMHDGQMLFDATTTWNKQEWQVDEVATELISQKATKKFIVVAIASVPEVRHSNYFPQKAFELLPKKQQDSLTALKLDGGKLLFGAKVNSDNYLKFIVKELKPLIDKKFFVNGDRANTFIAGSSMGGLISMYAICEYPEIFGGAACLSTHWPGTFAEKDNPIPGAFMAYMKSHLPDPKTHKIYFDYGDQTLDALYKPFQLKVDEIMKAKGYTAENWQTREFPGLDHSETSWAVRLDTPLVFLMGN